MLQSLAQFLRRAFSRRHLACADDDDARLDGIEQQATERLAARRDPADNHAGAQVVFAFEQGSLTGRAQIRAEQDAHAVEFTAKDDRVVVGFRKAILRVGMQHRPITESVTSIDLPQAIGR